MTISGGRNTEIFLLDAEENCYNNATHGARIDDRTGKVVNAFYDTNDVTKKITDRQQLICNILSIGDTGDDTNNDTNNDTKMPNVTAMASTEVCK